MSTLRPALLWIVALSGCGSPHMNGSEAFAPSAARGAGLIATDAGSVSAAAPAPSESLRSTGSPLSDSSNEGNDAPIRTDVVGANRLRIYTGRLEILVANVDDAVGRFVRLASEMGGYLENRDDGVVTCRIPAIRFDDALARARDLGQVLGESVKAEDVTRRHVDLRVRIENAERARERLLDLLGRASETTAILEIEKELRRLTEEVERMKAEMNWLNDQIASSTLTVAFRTDAPPPPPRRTRSRFWWLERVGLEPLLEEF